MPATHRIWVHCLLLLLLGEAVVWAEPAARRPNVVLILADDMGWRDPGFMGSDYHRTPNLDRLAAEGLVFDHAYANGAVCAPTRAALLSGMYAPRTGVYAVGGGRGGDDAAAAQPLLTPRNATSLDPDITTLPEALREAGYVTGHFGKWHLGRPAGPSGPEANGFDVSVGATRGGGTKTYFAPYGITTLRDAPDGEYLTNRLTDEAVGFIKDHADRPFFLLLSHYAVHTPIEAEPDVLAKVKARPVGRLHDHVEYAAMIESLDAGVGRLLRALDEAGVAENTVVVFTSDNGGHRRNTSMDPLKGAKGSLSEGGIRVPCVVRYPGVVEPGRRTDEPVLLFDLYPTLMELAGAAPRRSQPIDGVTWGPLLRGQASLKTRSLVWYAPVYNLSPSGRVITAPTAAIRRGRWKLVHRFEDGASELYDLENDPGERHDLAGAQPGMVRTLSRQLEAWRRATDAPALKANPDYDGSPAAAPREQRRRR